MSQSLIQQLFTRCPPVKVSPFQIHAGTWVGHVRAIKLCRIQPLLCKTFCMKGSDACFQIITIHRGKGVALKEQLKGLGHVQSTSDQGREGKHHKLVAFGQNIQELLGFQTGEVEGRAIALGAARGLKHIQGIAHCFREERTLIMGQDWKGP